MRVVLTIAALLVLAFQGCGGGNMSGTEFSSARTSPSTAPASAANPGVGLFLLYLTDANCSDEIAKNIIRFKSGEYFLERWNCETVSPPARLDPARIGVDPKDAREIVYDAEIYRQR